MQLKVVFLVINFYFLQTVGKFQINRCRPYLSKTTYGRYRKKEHTTILPHNGE